MVHTKNQQSILYLSSKQPSKKIIEFLKSKGHIVTISSNTIDSISEFDLVFSFGYKHILKEKLIRAAKRQPINLHISYLPFNRGYHPNFWAHYDGTLSGVTIHQIDAGIDSGEIIYRVPIEFSKNLNTFRNTWEYLNSEIEKLFINKFENILNFDFKSFMQESEGTFHLERDLPSDFKGWDSNIVDEISRLKSI